MTETTEIDVMSNLLASTAVAETDQYAGLKAFRFSDQMKALGTICFFMAGTEPFAEFPMGHWVDTFWGFVRRDHYFFSMQDDRIVGFTGWALASHDAAQDWVQGRRILSYEECLDGPCVLVMASHGLNSRIVRFYSHVIRATYADRETIFWKRPVRDGVRIIRFNLQTDGIRRRRDPTLIATLGPVAD